MRKQQLVLSVSAAVLVLLIFFFGKTTLPVGATPSTPNSSEETVSVITVDTLLNRYKKDIPVAAQQRLLQLESSVVRGDVHEQQVHMYHQLASYWGDTVNNSILAGYYLGKAAELENSEKNLNFAAHLLISNLLQSEDAAMNKWLATQSKEYLQKVLSIDPDNDSAHVGIGACYVFGGLSESPMQGIAEIQKVLQKDSTNLYAHMVLGVGGIKSGQYDKAAQHFTTVLNHEPDNIEAIFNLAELYDRQGDKQNAVKWYSKALDYVQIPEARKEIEVRINDLK